MPRAARVAIELLANAVIGALVIFPSALLLVATSSVLWDALLTYDGLIFTPLNTAVTGAWVAIASSMLAAVTLVVVILLGLPLRLIPRVHDWWASHWWLPLVGLFVGAMLVALSWPFGSVYTGSTNGFDFEQYQPHGGTLLAGWFVFAFCVVNLWFGRRRV